jgi:uncharacterized coiled-coil protein SlyX
VSASINLVSVDVVTTDVAGITLSTQVKEVAVLEQASASSRGKIIGITSENYGDFTSTGHNVVDASHNPLPVALNGRVIVRVSSEQGKIAVGDPITAGSKPGVGVKAVTAGRVVGTALSDYTNSNPNEVGEVLVFVNPTWYDPQTILTNTGDLNLPGDATIEGELVVGGRNILTELDDLDTVVTNLAASVTAHTTSLASLTSQYAGLATNVSSLESVVSSQDDRISDLESQLAAGSSLQTTSLGIGVSAPASGSGKLVDTLSGAYLSSSGIWTNVSDETKKENFTDLDQDQILSGILSLGISRWNYKSDSDTITHIGPTAQQFYSVFGVGDNNKTISTLDPASIALVGVKALANRLNSMESAVSSQREHISSLESVVSSQQDDIGYLMDLNQEGEVNMKKLAQEMDEIRLATAQNQELGFMIQESEDQTTFAPTPTLVVENTDASSNNPTSTIQNPESDLLTKLTERLNALEGLVLGMQDELPEPFVASSSSEPTFLIDNPISNIQDLRSSIENIEATVSAELLDNGLEISDFRFDILKDLEMLSETLSLATQSATLSQQTMELTGDNSDATLENLIVANKAQVYDLNIAGKLTTGFVEIDGIAGTISTVMQPLQLQTNPLAGNLEVFNRKIVMTTGGDIEIQGTLRAEKVEAKEVKAIEGQVEKLLVGRLQIATESAQMPIDTTSVEQPVAPSEEGSVNGPSIGKGVMKEGRRRVLVRTKAVTENSSVFVTATSSTGGQSLYVETIRPGLGFYAEVDEDLDQEVKFNWWVVN